MPLNPYEDEDEEEDSFDLWREDAPESGSGALVPFWAPTLLRRPEIAPQLHQLPWPLRCSEVIRFTALGLEYWLSPKGFLREWIRINLYVAVTIGVSSALLIPPLAALLSGGVEFSVQFHEIVQNVSKAALCLPPAVMAIAGLFVLFRLLQRFWRVRRRFDFDRYE